MPNRLKCFTRSIIWLFIFIIGMELLIFLDKYHNCCNGQFCLLNAIDTPFAVSSFIMPKRIDKTGVICI